MEDATLLSFQCFSLQDLPLQEQRKSSNTKCWPLRAINFCTKKHGLLRVLADVQDQRKESPMCASSHPSVRQPSHPSSDEGTQTHWPGGPIWLNTYFNFNLLRATYSTQLWDLFATTYCNLAPGLKTMLFLFRFQIQTSGKYFDGHKQCLKNHSFTSPPSGFSCGACISVSRHPLHCSRAPHLFVWARRGNTG